MSRVPSFRSTPVPENVKASPPTESRCCLTTNPCLHFPGPILRDRQGVNSTCALTVRRPVESIPENLKYLWLGVARPVHSPARRVGPRNRPHLAHRRAAARQILGVHNRKYRRAPSSPRARLHPHRPPQPVIGRASPPAPLPATYRAACPQSDPRPRTRMPPRGRHPRSGSRLSARRSQTHPP